MRRLLIALGILFAAAAFAQNDNPDATILQGLVEEEEFSTLVALIEQAGLVDTLSGPGPFTLFAPHNAAFEELGDEVVAQLQNDPVLLEQILLGHVIEGRFGLNELQDAEDGTVTSLQGEALNFRITLGGLVVNGADLDSLNVENSYANGVVHVVGDVVFPTSMAAAFGGDVAEVETAAPSEEPTVFSALRDRAEFSTLAALLQQTGLVDVLEGDGPFTLFAPTDEAFGALSDERLTSLQNDPALLRRVLTYHLVQGDIRSTDIRDGPVITVEGGELQASTEDGVAINDASVTVSDLEVGNGVIHTIDRVLLPADLN